MPYMTTVFDSVSRHMGHSGCAAGVALPRKRRGNRLLTDLESRSAWRIAIQWGYTLLDVGPQPCSPASPFHKAEQKQECGLNGDEQAHLRGCDAQRHGGDQWKGKQGDMLP